MYGIVLVSHGLLAKGLVDTSKVIVGDCDIPHAGLHEGHDLEYFEKDLEQKILDQKAQYGDVIVLTDLMYGTPFNTVSRLMEKIDFLHFTGINLPILLEIITSRNSLSLEEIRERVEIEKHNAIICVNTLLEQIGDEDIDLGGEPSA